MISVKRQGLFIFSIIGIVTTSLLMMTTYAYQTTKIEYSENSNTGLTVNSGVLDVNFTTKDSINVENMPLLHDYLSADSLEFTIDNSNSNTDVSFTISLIELEYSNSLKTNDFKYTLTEVIDTNKEKSIANGNFSDLTNEEYKLKFDSSYYLDIDKGTNKTYKLYLWLKETEENQNYLENAHFKAKMKITSVFKSSVYENSLAYDIKNKNNILENIDVFDSLENGLVKINDKYYFRGIVNNNYVNYNNMCFRIVNINNDETIKLVLEDKDNICENSTGNYEIGNGINIINETYDNNMLDNLLNFQETYLNNNLNNLKPNTLCIENKKYNLEDIEITEPTNEYNYLPKRRLNGKIIYDDICNGVSITKFNNNKNIYVNALNLDDLIYIGYKLNEERDTYLYNDYFANLDKSFWINSLSYYKDGINYGFNLNNKTLNELDINNTNNYRPTITLIKNTSFQKGDGSKQNPYYIE